MNALAVLGGESCSAALLRAEHARAALVAGVDSGAQALLAQGLRCDLLVGDMDSIDPAALARLLAGGAEPVRFNPDKDQTDAHLALDLLLARGARQIMLLGGLGGRLDHTLGNLQLLLRAHQRGASACLRDDLCTVRLLHGALTLTGQPGDLFSVIPMLGHAARVQILAGAQYGVGRDLPMLPGETLGISNVFTATQVRLHSDAPVLVVTTATGAQTNQD